MSMVDGQIYHPQTQREMREDERDGGRETDIQRERDGERWRKRDRHTERERERDGGRETDRQMYLINI
jgi:hypothetical protein